jgi:uncharacterized protein (TIGR04255 family)
MEVHVGKKLNNPPVCLVLAQLKFNEVVSISESALAQLGDKFAGLGFVNFKRDNRNRVKVSFSTLEGSKVEQSEFTARFLFEDKTRTSSLVLDTNSLALETTLYQTSEAFFETFLRALNAVHEVRDINFCERLGMRMLDAIQAKKGKSLSDYVLQGLLGASQISSIGLPHRFTFSQSVFASPPDALIFKTMHSEEGIALPTDLADITQRLKFDKRFEAHHGETLMLDTDGVHEGRFDYSQHELQKHLQKLKLGITQVFRSVTTEWARTEAWN